MDFDAMRWSWILACLMSWAVPWVETIPTWGQTPTPPNSLPSSVSPGNAPATTVPNGAAVPMGETLESLDKKIADLEAAQLDDAVKAKARELYQQARQLLSEVESAAAKNLADYQARISTAPERLLKQQRLEASGDGSSPLLMPPDNADLTELETLLAERQEEQKRLEELVKVLDPEPQRRATRRLEIPKDLAALKASLADIEKQLSVPADASEPPAVTQARRTLLAVRQQTIKTQIAALEAELAAYDAEKDLPSRERIYARNRLAQVMQSIESLTSLINERRSNEVERRHQRILRDVKNAPAVLKAEAEENLKLSNEARELVYSLATITTTETALSNELTELKARIEKSKRRVERGASATAVLSLRQDRIFARERLERLKRDLEARSATISQLQERLIELQDMSDEYGDIDARVAKIAQEKGFALSPEEEQALTAQLRELLETRRELIDDLSVRTNQYFEKLVEFTDTTDEFITELKSYLEFIDERILWMRSTDVLSWQTIVDAGRLLARLPDSVQQLVSHAAELRQRLWREFLENKLLTATFLLVIFSLYYYQSRLRAILVGLGEVAAKGNCVLFTPTLEAALVTFLISLPWGLALAYVGWRLLEAGHPAGQGLLGTAAIYLPLEGVRQMCRRKGLGEAHFGWSERVLNPLRANLRWYVVASLPFIFVSTTIHSDAISTGEDSLGRLAFMSLMLVTSLFLQRVVRPRGGVFQEYLSYHPGGWADRLAIVWYPFICLGPLALAVLAGVGYYYTAWHLGLRLFRTALVIIAVTVVGSVLHRWLLISRRRLAIRQARERQQRMQEQTEGESSPPADTAVDLAVINQQTRRLIRSSLWLMAVVFTWIIWSDVLPALAIFKDIRLYQTEGIEPGVIVSVTLADLGVAVLAAVMTTIAARNLPGLIEIVLLQKLPLDSSVRYAITTVGRYLIVLAGLIIVSSSVGLSWRRLQWLVAALGVGLGFGLQEIFANFVSGVILLFERPIRLGDVITLGDVTGAVTRIRIRATTLRDWDGKELVVPNKDLITGRLLNWTLTDTRNRVVLRVGIAYGSNVALARRLILDIARAHPDVLKEPEPTVTFEEFGDSALLLVLRAFLPRLDQRLPCINDLHLAIDRAFREHGIEIAFPQMDVHIRDVASIPVSLSPPPASSEASRLEDNR